jgi:hypothetical protein
METETVVSIGNGFSLKEETYKKIKLLVAAVVTNHWLVQGAKRPAKRNLEPYTRACYAAATKLRKAIFPPKTAECGVYLGQRARVNQFHYLRYDSLQSMNN